MSGLAKPRRDQISAFGRLFGDGGGQPDPLIGDSDHTATVIATDHMIRPNRVIIENE